MSQKKRIAKAAPRGRGESSVWYNGPDAIRLVAESAPPKVVEIGGAPVTDTTHEFVLRKPDAQD